LADLWLNPKTGCRGGALLLFMIPVFFFALKRLSGWLLLLFLAATFLLNPESGLQGVFSGLLGRLIHADKKNYPKIFFSVWISRCTHSHIV
jgi:succinate dehydrogenase/fumarate reductase cytochrome b subunit